MKAAPQHCDSCTCPPERHFYSLGMQEELKRMPSLIGVSRQCGDCGVGEGDFHKRGCDMERCPFCGHQLISCGCIYRHLYPDTYSELPPGDPDRPEFAGLPEDVYKDGLRPEQTDEWERMLEEKGLIPWVCYPNMCGRCGMVWPKMFMVPDEEWDRYVEPEMRGRMLCRLCFDWIKHRTDEFAERRARKNAAAS